MEVALWTAIGSALAVMAKGASVGDEATPDQKQKVIDDLTNARRELEKRIRDMELGDKKLDLQARKDLLVEERDRKITESREIKEAEAVWARATPETLIAFAKARIAAVPAPTGPELPPAPEPVVPDVVPVAAPEPVVPDVVPAAAPEPVVPDVVPAAAPEPVVPDVVPAAEPVVPAAEPVVPDVAPAVEEGLDEEGRRVALVGGAQTDSIDAVYKTLVDSAIARGYTIRGSLSGFHSKIVDAWKKDKGNAPLPAELEKMAFLKEAAKDIQEAEEAVQTVKATEKSGKEAVAAAAKKARKDADEAVSVASRAISESDSRRKAAKTELKKLAPLLVSLSGAQCLGSAECSVSKADAEAKKNLIERLLRLSDSYEVGISKVRKDLSEKRSKAVIDEELPAHLDAETMALNATAATLSKNTDELASAVEDLAKALPGYRNAVRNPASAAPLFTGVSADEEAPRPAMEVPAPRFTAGPSVPTSAPPASVPPLTAFGSEPPVPQFSADGTELSDTSSDEKIEAFAAKKLYNLNSAIGSLKKLERSLSKSVACKGNDECLTAVEDLMNMKREAETASQSLDRNIRRRLTSVTNTDEYARLLPMIDARAKTAERITNEINEAIPRFQAVLQKYSGTDFTMSANPLVAEQSRKTEIAKQKEELANEPPSRLKTTRTRRRFGGSRKSTLKKRRGGKQNVRGAGRR